ncbi:PadR family transcriptional regulator [Natrinema longum]|uniref:PadR family transcriptional regulator n=1 Tax=Natrinema longum TaxID=370324 RepID=A0A8A2UCP3_9EURY|nr:PadR family transcriptional regulator [Natrinema longum]MBZ6495546.1 PadR family transcriptional regulator [Natrinema longum]QSW86489.1 PadR family transcriptional regulator [Natrinema longum]
MSDDDSRDLERPARADASPADTTDDRRAWAKLTGFQRDCLEAVARREHEGYPCYPWGIAETIERWYPRVSPGRLESSLRALVDRDLVTTRDGLPGSVHAYRLTGAGRALLVQRADRLAVLRERRPDHDAIAEGTTRGEGADRPTGARDEDSSGD